MYNRSALQSIHHVQHKIPSIQLTTRLLQTASKLPAMVPYKLMERSQSIHDHSHCRTSQSTPSQSRLEADMKDRARRPQSDEYQLLWTEQPRNVLVIKKKNDTKTTEAMRAVIRWFEKNQPAVNILIEKESIPDISTQSQSANSIHVIEGRTGEQSDLLSAVDFVVTLGGDGTLLHASSLFPYRVPPIISFSLGSVGFLLPFEFSDYQIALSRMFGKEGVPVMNRIRLAFSLYDSKANKKLFKDYKHVDLQIMNELTVHRGKHAQLTAVDIFVGNQFLTDVVADGLIISTPTGSTAYSLSAGGPIVHPSVQALLLTPICPRSLSFRPIVLPATAEIRIKLSSMARGDAEVTVDGRDMCLLEPNHYIGLRLSEYYIPCVSRIAAGSGWADDIKQTLRWNQSFLNAGLFSSSSK
ncbi:hypothetical protein BDV3_002631 [Batrachochytrium dendrobatidis]